MKKILVMVVLLMVSACTGDVPFTAIKEVESICANNKGVHKMRAELLFNTLYLNEVACNDGASFNYTVITLYLDKE